MAKWTDIERKRREVATKKIQNTQKKVKQQRRDNYIYSTKCSIIADKYNLPIEVVMALGSNSNYREIKFKVKTYKNWLEANKGSIGLEIVPVFPGTFLKRWVPIAPTLNEVLSNLSSKNIEKRKAQIEEIIGVVSISDRGDIRDVARWLINELKK